MRKRLFSAVLILLVLLTGMQSAMAANEYSTIVVKRSAESAAEAVPSENGEYFVFSRAVDLRPEEERLSQEERTEITEEAFSVMEDIRCDIQFYIIPSLREEGFTSADELADLSYANEQYPGGYGSNGNAIFVIYETDTEKCHIVTFGQIPGLSDWGVMKAQQFFSYYLRVGNAYDACRGFMSIIRKDITKAADVFVPREDMMNEAHFVPFQNNDISRVLDYAGLISESAENDFLDRIAKIREDYGLDVVILTVEDPEYDDTKMTPFADDFYDYVGFGCGAERSGILLFVNMDPSVRYYTISTCGQAIDYFYDDYIESTYDQMLDKFASGNYERGINVYLDNVEAMMLVTHEPNEFDGIAKEDISFSKDNIVDDKAGMLSAADVKNIEDAAKLLRSKRDMDVLVLTVNDEILGAYPQDVYATRYMRFHGYDESSYDGLIALVVNADYPQSFQIVTAGEAGRFFRSNTVQHIEDSVSASLRNGKKTEAVKAFAHDVKFYGKWRHFPLRTVTAVVIFILIFTVVSIVALCKKLANRSVKTATSADPFLVPGSYQLYHVQETFLKSNVVKSRRPEPSSSSGYRSGGSSHSSSVHHSSSGTSHGGGGGRHF